MDENKLYGEYLYEMCLREKYGSKNNITFDEWKRIKSANADFIQRLKSAMGNTQLTTLPELSATTLLDCCYTNMFQGCISLTNALELPT